jgi:hypothetical protein
VSILEGVRFRKYMVSEMLNYKFTHDTQIYWGTVKILISGFYTTLEHNVWLKLQFILILVLMIASTILAPTNILIILNIQLELPPLDHKSCPVPKIDQFKNKYTLTTLSQQVEITLSKCLRVWQVFERWTHRCLADIWRTITFNILDLTITNAISKN